MKKKLISTIMLQMLQFIKHKDEINNNWFPTRNDFHLLVLDW
jgi:hypothetical protein